MGCGSSKFGPEHESGSLPSLIRHPLDNIRRRRRVVDALAMEETTLSTEKLLIKEGGEETNSPPTSVHDRVCGDDDKSRSAEGPMGSEVPRDFEKERVEMVVKAVGMAIDELLMEEEREYAKKPGGDPSNNNADECDTEKTKVINAPHICPGSPSFRVYCTVSESFDGVAVTDDEPKKTKPADAPKPKHERRKSGGSHQSVSSNEEQDGSGSNKGKSERRKSSTLKKADAPARKKGAPLGMKNLLNMSCYSCSAHDRTHILSQ